MARKKKGRDVIKKIIPLLIDSPPATRKYHADYQRLNRSLDRELGRGDNHSIRKLERQAERFFNDMEKVLNKKLRL